MRLVWILLGIALVLILLRTREHYVIISGPGVRPGKTADWLSKIDAEAPIGANDDDYLAVLQDFYDQVYKPARTTNPDVFIRDTEVKSFADAVTRPGVDKDAIRKIITAGFAVERTGTAQAREEQQLVKTEALAGFEGANLEPKMGVDEVRTRKEEPYVPTDTRLGPVPEGLYKPTQQQDDPRREGLYDDKSISWTQAQFSSVKNVA